MWYALKMGLSMHEALTAPYALILSLIAVSQISEGAERKLSTEEEQDEFMKMLTRK